MPDFDRLLRAWLEEGALPARPHADDLVPWLPLRPQMMGEAVGASLPQLDVLEAEWFGPAPEGEPQMPRRPHQLGFVEQAFGDSGGDAGERMPRWQAFVDPWYRPFAPAVMLTPPAAYAQGREWPQDIDALLPAGTDAEPSLRAAYAELPAGPALPAQAAGGLPLATQALEQVSMRGAVTELDLSQVEDRLVQLAAAMSMDAGGGADAPRVREDRRTERLGGVNADVHDGMRQRTGGRDLERYLR